MPAIRPRFAGLHGPALVALLILSCVSLPGVASAQTFSLVNSPPVAHTGELHAGILWLDYDGDGDDDILSLASASDGGTHRLLQNNAGVFTQVAAGDLDVEPSGAAAGAGIADYDNDGDPDIYIVTASANRLLRNDGGVFTDVTAGDLAGSSSSSAAGWADYDLDGDQDLYIANATANRLLRNDGDGVFVDVTTGPLGDTGNTRTLAWGDFDGDGDPDLFLPNQAPGTNRLLRNDAGTFVDVTTPVLAGTADHRAAAWVDVDNDLDLDLVLTALNVGRVLRNDGGTVFVDVTPPGLFTVGSNIGLGWGDFDNDGDQDCYLTGSSGGEQNRLLRNDGGFTFTNVTPAPLLTNTGSSTVSWGDFNQDGRLDLLVSRWTTDNTLFENLDPSGNHWLAVRLASAASNRDAVGARVLLTSGGVTQLREVTSVSGWGNSDSRAQHFGLGVNTTIDALQVIWPSGLVQDVDLPIAVDQTLLVTEPDLGLVASDGHFEERTSLSWNGGAGNDYLHRVERDGQLVALLGANQLSYEDEAGTPGQVHTYRVLRVDTQDQLLMAGIDLGSRELFAPTSIDASDSLFIDGVRITWRDESRIESGYTIYRRDLPAGVFLAIANVDANIEAYDDKTAVGGISYEYAVAVKTAFDGQVYQSPTLAELSTGPTRDIGSRGFVVPPAAVAATDGDWPDRVRVTWDDNSASESGFRIYRNGTLVTNVGPNVTEWDDLGFEGSNQTVHTYCVTTVKALASLKSTPVGGLAKAVDQESVQVCDPGAGGPNMLPGPLALAATDAEFDDRVELTWEAPGGAADSLRVYRDGLVVAELHVAATSWQDNLALGAVPGQVHAYSVQSFTAEGGSSFLIAPAANDFGSMAAVIAPTDVVATDGAFEDLVEVRWKSASTTASLFKIYRDAVFVKTVAVAPGVGEYSVTDDDIDTASHTWVVTAVTALGAESPTTGTDTGYRTILPPGAVSASDGDFEHIVRITWSDESVIEDGYRIYRKLDGDPDVNLVEVGTTAANRNVFDDTTTAPGVLYEYAVVAFDDLGGESDYGRATGSRNLKAPTGLLASDDAFEGKVELRWNDNSRREDGFRVYRRDAGTADPFVQVSADLPVDATTYTDTAGVEVGDAYEYAIRAFDFGGESEDPLSWDVGSTTMLPPTEVNASDAYAGEVVVSWLDRSDVNIRYDIERDGIKVGEAGADDTMFSHHDPAPGLGAYGVIAVSAGGLTTDPVIAYGQVTELPATEVLSDTNSSTGAFERSLAAEGGRFMAFDGNYFVWSYTAGLAPSVGQVYVHEAQPDGTWSFLNPACGPSTCWIEGVNGFGQSLDTSETFLVVGGEDQDSVFVRSNRNNILGECTAWGNGEQVAEPQCAERTVMSPHAPDNRFYGLSVGISRTLMVVGAPEMSPGNAGLVDVWRRDEVTHDWTLETTFDGSSFVDGLFGQAVDIDQDVVVIGIPDAPGGGMIRIAERIGVGNWVVQDINRPVGQTGRFGAMVEVDGPRIVVGSSMAVTSQDTPVNLFERNALLDWQLTETLAAPNGLSGFGYSLSLAGPTLAVGAPSNGGSNEIDGSVYMYQRRSDGTWTPGQVLTSTALDDETSDDLFGLGVELGDDTIAIASRQIVLMQDLPVPPVDYEVTASDATSDDRIQVRWSNLADEISFRVFRDGVLLDEVDANILRFDDFEANPGRVYEYCVVGVTPGGDVSLGCDFGRRPPDGIIAGRVATFEGAGVGGVEVCLDPGPNRGILLDGARGEYVSERIAPIQDINASAFTIEFWVRGNEAGDAGTPFSWEQDITYPRRAPIRVENLADLRLSVGGETSPSSGIDIADGLWHHVAVTWAGRISGAGQIWVDGAPGPQFTIGQNTYVTPGVIHLGQHINEKGIAEPNFPFHGELDELRIWEGVLDAADMDARRNQRLLGSEDDLRAYWSFDDGEGVGVPDQTGKGWYLRAVDGAFSTREGVPSIETCAVTDDQGNYVLRADYGDETQFTLTPQAPGRSFSPSFKTIVLSEQTPVQNEVEFIETTALTVSGTIRFRDEAGCVAKNVEIRVDGIPQGQTNDLGEYELVLDFGTHVIRPVAGDRQFFPAEAVLDLAQSASDVDFEELTSRELTLRVGGGDCRYPIGTLRLGIESESGCLPPTFVEISDLETLTLPPQKYFVYLDQIVSTQLDAGTLTTWFDRLGSQEVDLTSGDGVLDFLYRAPMEMVIEGLPDLPAACDPQNPVISLPGGGTIPAVPVIDQGENYPLSILVVEDYGDGNHCVVETGTVTVYDEIIDEQDQPVQLIIEDGYAMVETDGQRTPYVTIGNTPNPAVGRRDAQNNDRSYQKAISFVAQVEGQTPLTVTEWAMVTGHRPREATFTTVSDGIPLMVLRDPPGDGSSAYLSEGQSFCTTFETAALVSTTRGTRTQIKGGIEFTKGFGFMTDTSVEATTEGKLDITMAANAKNQVEICATATERISTSSSGLFVGDAADVFMGVGVNFIFAKTDVLELDGCDLVSSEAVAMGASGFDTVYLYTADHIENTVIPALDDIVESGAGDSSTFALARLNWESHLALNERLKAEASFKRNRSFSAGADFNYEETSTFKDTFTWEASIKAESSASVTLGFEESGSGVETQFTTTFSGSFSQGGTVSDGESRTIGYTLSDDDQGDFFTVDVKEDGTYGTPVFELVEGTSSCPHELGTQPRDKATLAMNPPVLAAVSPDSTASFTVAMTNIGDSGEARDFVLVPVQASNPGGAVLKLNGESFSGGIGLRLNHQQTQEAILTVERGPTRFHYEDLELMLIPACSFTGTPKEVAGSASVKFSVGFVAPCTDVTVTRPLPGWIHNSLAAAEDDTLDILLTDYLIDLGGGQPLQRLRASYRANGTGTWKQIAEITDFQTDPRIGPDGSASIRWGLDNVPDGSYEIRASATCEAGTVLSTIVRGTIDRQAPVTTERHPADNLLTVGEVIRADFNEPIDCLTVNRGTVTLTNLTESIPVTIDVVCDDDGAIVIEALNPRLTAMEDDVLQVDVSGVRDVAGNPAADFDWSFTVQQSAFSWAGSAISQAVPFDQARSIRLVLANGTPDDGTFSIDTSGTPFLTATPATGLIRTGEEIEVRFDYHFTDTADIGLAFSGDVIATLDVGQGPPLPTSLVSVWLDVECTASDPIVVDAGAYAHGMTLVADLDFGLAGPGAPGDAIVAYVGSQPRGYAVVETVSVGGASRDLAFLTVYSNIASGEVVRFAMVDLSECRTYPGTDRYITFVAEARLGTTLAPELFNARQALNAEGQNIDLAAGWNWISLNVVGDDMSVPFVLGNLNPQEGDQIKSLTGEFAEYVEGLGWIGSLDDLGNEYGYQLHIAEGGTIVLPGSDVLPSLVPIPVQAGWNWIGYTPRAAQGTKLALNALEDGRLSGGDLLKSQFRFSEYDAVDEDWVGNLTQMEPGLGYRLFLQVGAGSTFTYPQTPVAVLAGRIGGVGESDLDAPSRLSIGGKAGAVGGKRPMLATKSAGPAPGADLARKVSGTAWSLDPRRYEHTMTVTAELGFSDGGQWDESQVLVAVSGSEVRGIASPMFIDGLGEHRVFMMVYSNDLGSEVLELELFDPELRATREVDATLRFRADSAVGTASAPFQVPVGEAIEETLIAPTRFQFLRPSPNPLAGAHNATILSYGLPASSRVQVAVYDVRGRRVQLLLDQVQDAGWHQVPFDGRGVANGVYMVRIVADGWSGVQKITVLK